MKATISLEGLWQAIQSLSVSNQKWLSEKLIENIKEKEDMYISKEKILSGIDSGLKDMKQGNGVSSDDFLNELRGERM